MLPLAGCMEWDYGQPEPVDTAPRGLFIVNEGNFQYGNATLSFYNPVDRTVENEVFTRANGMKLGDVAQSMTVVGHDAWIIVNNSNVIFKVNASTLQETGRLSGLVSPRFMLVINSHKAYVSRLWDNNIVVIDPSTMTVTGQIEVPGMDRETGSTERMVMADGMVYCTCWSYQNRLIKIDPATDRVVGSIAVGVQPKSIVTDRNNHLWVMTDGGFAGNPAGYEQPALVEIEPDELAIIRRLRFPVTDSPASLAINGSGDTLYWINDGVYSMSTDATALPTTAFIPSRGTTYYSLSVDPVEGDVYVADAIDYQQPGMVYRYSAEGRGLDNFRVGINPGAFAWKEATP